MKAERLFRILGLVDESLVEEAVSASSPAAVQRRHPWRRLAAAAACLAVICGGVFLAGAGLVWFGTATLAGDRWLGRHRVVEHGNIRTRLRRLTADSPTGRRPRG